VSQAYRHKETSVFLLNYHIIFCPKRRRKILVAVVKERLEQLLHETCAEIECEILELEIMPDHLHLFVSVLTQKAESAARQVIAVNLAYTSQDCSHCGERVPKKLSVRLHSCPYCGFEAHRDVNATLNVLKIGGDTAFGETATLVAV
jgi:REP element-mobilizing transposase RayT